MAPKRSFSESVFVMYGGRGVTPVLFRFSKREILSKSNLIICISDSRSITSALNPLKTIFVPT